MNEDIDRVIRYVYNEFGREFGDSIVDLKQQLQAYKDKEDKLREYIYSVNNWNWKKLEGRNGTQIIREELLQILNEGSDK